MEKFLFLWSFKRKKEKLIYSTFWNKIKIEHDPYSQNLLSTHETILCMTITTHTLTSVSKILGNPLDRKVDVHNSNSKHPRTKSYNKDKLRGYRVELQRSKRKITGMPWE